MRWVIGKGALTTAILWALAVSLPGCSESPSDVEREVDGGTTLAPAAPEEAGFDADQLDAAVDLYRERVEDEDLMGVVLMVARDGKVVLHEALGWRDRENELPMEENTIFRMASNTKAVVSTAAMILAEEGELDLDDPVADYIPAFDEGQMADITVAHLMSHSSGLPRSPIFLSGVDEDSDLVREAERFAEELELEAAPGSRYGYSNVGYNVLGGVIEAATGRNLEVVLTERIYDPLGMVDSNNHETNSDHDRMGKVYRGSGDDLRVRWAPGDPPSYPIVRASGGMNSTADDFAIFLQMWLDGGIYDDVRLLSEDLIAEGGSVQAPTSSYGYGWWVASSGRLTHGGSDGTWAWVHPNDDVIGMVFTQHRDGDNPRTEFRDRVHDAIVGPP